MGAPYPSRRLDLLHSDAHAECRLTKAKSWPYYQALYFFASAVTWSHWPEFQIRKARLKASVNSLIFGCATFCVV